MKLVVIAHQVDLSGAPRSLLNILSNERISCFHRISLIAMRGGELGAQLRVKVDDFYELTPKLITNKLENVLLFFKLFSILLFEPRCSRVLINSSINLRAMFCCYLQGRRAVVYVRESEQMLNSVLGIFRKILLSRMYRVVCVSESTSLWVKKYVSSERVSVIHNGYTKEDLIRAECSYGGSIQNDGIIRVGIVGNIDFRKGVDRFHSIVERASSMNFNFEFIVIGRIVDDYWMNEIIKLSVGNVQIKITGIVENVFPFMQSCNVIVMLSREEALPRVVMEAGLLGCSIVTMDTAGTHELLPINYPYIVRDFDCEVFLDKIVLAQRDLWTRRKIRENILLKFSQEDKVAALMETLLSK